MNRTQAVKQNIIPALQRATTSLGLWERVNKSTFQTGLTGNYGLPLGVYQVDVSRTGKITVSRATQGTSFSVTDKRAREIYSTLERLEKAA